MIRKAYKFRLNTTPDIDTKMVQSPTQSLQQKLKQLERAFKDAFDKK
ncbi:MAG: hypothetical protein ACJAS1_004385 [Oleiphilaceae bacterium]|jgi:hypothetical protein